MFDKPVVFKQLSKDEALVEIAYPWAFETMPLDPNNREANNRFDELHNGSRGSDWWGAPTGAIALDRMKHGWPEGLELIRKRLEFFDIPALPRRRRARWGMMGELDVERAQNMEMDPFRDKPKVIAPVVRITVDVAHSWIVTGEQISWQGAVTTVLSETLTNAGFDVEIIACCTDNELWYDGPNRTTTFMRIKDAGTPISLPSVAGTLFTASGYRIGMFNVWARHNKWRVTRHFGYPIEMPEHLAGDVHVPRNIRSFEAAKRFLDELPTMKRADLRNFMQKGGR